MNNLYEMPIAEPADNFDALLSAALSRHANPAPPTGLEARLLSALHQTSAISTGAPNQTSVIPAGAPNQTSAISTGAPSKHSFIPTGAPNQNGVISTGAKRSGETPAFAPAHARVATPLFFTTATRVATPRSTTSTWTALGLHAAAILLIAFAVSHHVQLAAPVTRIELSLTAPPPPPPLTLKNSSMGGGGGQHDLAPVTQGHLPQLAQQQITPPKAPPTLAPKLAIEPTVVVQPDLHLADNKLPDLGLPNSSLHGPVSLGNGSGTGLGSGSGAGIGPGSGGSLGGGVYRVGGAVKAPILLNEVQAEFSEEARKAKFSGNVIVGLIVDENGNPTHVHVVRDVGLGLGEKALEAVRQYKFRPAMKDGKPVKVEMSVEVNFQVF